MSNQNETGNRKKMSSKELNSFIKCLEKKKSKETDLYIRYLIETVIKRLKAISNQD